MSAHHAVSLTRVGSHHDCLCITVTNYMKHAYPIFLSSCGCEVKSSDDNTGDMRMFEVNRKLRISVGPLEGSDRNIITEGFLMAENLNEYFGSMFTREDISILPVLETKFEGREFDYLGQLIVTPTMVAMKIRDMKDNKSPGVDGIPPKLLLEIVEQISIPLATVFSLSLEEGIVPLEWKEANIIPLFKKGSRNKSENYRPVSLTSVICKLLERLIKDHLVDFLVKNKLINPSQHGFLKARSCLTNILCFFGRCHKVGR